MKWTIRQEKTGDETAIAQTIRLAFAGKAYADGNEERLPEKLRACGALVLSLVAVERKAVIGHACLSPARIGEEKWLCLGPVSVLPAKQGQGIGSALVSSAVGVAKAYGRGGVILLGDPNFYRRLGFQQTQLITYQGTTSPHLQFFAFGDPPVGEAGFHPAFDG